MYVTLRGAAIAVLAIAAFGLVARPTGLPGYGVESPALGAMGALLALWVARSGRLRLASFALLAGFGASCLASFVYSNGIYTMGLPPLVLCIVLAGLLLGPRSALLAAGLAGLCVASLDAFLQARGTGPDGSLDRLESTWWIATFVVSGALSALVASRVQGALADADASEQGQARRAQALAVSEDRYRALFENSPLGAMLVDPDLTVVRINRELMRLLGVPKEGALVGHRLDAFPVFGAVDLLHQRDRLLRGERVEFDAAWTSAWGAKVEVRIHIAPIFDDEGEISGAQALVEDVARQKQLESQLRQAQKLEAMGRLAGSVAHDFNNYLTAILGNADLLGEHAGTHPEAKEALEQILHAADRSASITRQLLAFSRTQLVEPCLLDPNQAVERLRPMLDRLFGSNVVLDLDLDPESGAVHIDPSQLEVVLLNLATNARDAMPDGGRLRIATRCRTLDPDSARALGLAPGPFVEVCVADQGAGMDEATRLRIFEPFFTTKDEGRGTGLGLATVHGVTRQNGGTVQVESEAGEGSVFRVLLPRAAGPLDRVEPAEDHAPAGIGRETILLVDDQPEVQRTVAAMLERNGYNVIRANDGEQALKELESGTPDVDMLLTDLVMPGMSGTELAARVSEDRPRLPVLLVSGYAEPSLDGVDAHATLGSSLLRKPFTTAQLLTAVRRQLDAKA